MILKIIDFIIGKANFSIKVNDSHDVAVLNILRESGFYDCIAQEEKITFSCACEKSKSISKQLDELGVPYEKNLTGLVCLIKRLFSRTGLLLGILGVIALHTYFSGIVWEIDVVGNKNVSDEDVMRVLLNHRVHVGMPKKDLDIKSLTRDFMQSDSRFSFAHMNVNGIRATLEVAEAVSKSEQKVDKKQVCNIVSKCDGVITRIDVYSGGREAENGQSVVKGQLLISSFFETRTSGLLLRRAKGTAFARTEPVLEMIIPKKKYEKTPAFVGEKTELSILDMHIPVSGTNVLHTDERMDMTTQNFPIRLFGVLKIPAVLQKQSFSFYTLTEKERDKNEAQRMFEKELEKARKRYSENGEIIEEHVEMTENENDFVFVCRFSCIESIGIDKPFEIREN